MSMTTVAAKVYVARIIGGGAESQESLDMAGEAILRAYQDWQTRKFWSFLLKDNARTTAISATATKSSAVVNAPSVGAFDGLNPGQSVTYSGAAGTLTASSTILSITRGSDGVATSITLSNAMGGGTYTTETGTFTFGAYITLVPGTNDYAVPTDFFAPYTARLLTNKRTLTYREPRWWDRVIVDQTVLGTPSDYGMFNEYSELTQNYGTKRIRFDRVPDITDTLHLKYYRAFNTTGSNVDIPDEFLYQFLDYARGVLLATKRAQDDPAGYTALAQQGTESAEEQDEQTTDDDDADRGLKSQYEMGDYNRPLWGNGGFDPYRY